MRTAWISLLLLVTVAVRAQQVDNTILNAFAEYHNRIPDVKLHLVFNQQKYSPGDTAYFKAYFLDEYLKGIEGKQLINLDMIDSQGKSVVHLIFATVNGTAFNQIAIPDTLQPGIFLVTAYSNWMRNGDPLRVFKKELIIVSDKGIVREPAQPELHNAQPREYELQLTASPQKSDPVKVAITFPENSYLKGHELIAVVTARGRIFYSQVIPVAADASLQFQFSQQGLPGGIAHVSVLDHNRKLIASRDFYSPAPDSVHVDVRTNGSSFQTREKVKCDIALTDESGKALEGEFSFNVVNTTVLGVPKENSLPDELNVLFGLAPGFTIDRTAQDWFSELDQFLARSTQPLPWDKILANPVPAPHYSFTTNIQKTGTVSYADTGEPVPDSTQIMFYLQKNMIRYQTFTLNSGRVRLTLPDIYGDDEFFYWAETKKGKEIPNLKIIWDKEPPVNAGAAPRSHLTAEEDDYAIFTSRNRLIKQSFKLYTTKSDVNINRKLSGDEFADEIMGADIEVRVEDYVLLASMPELIREVIHSVTHRLRGGRNVVRVKLDPASPNQLPPLPHNDPLYVIDGRATHNTDYFLSLKPADLLTVKVVKDAHKLALFGLMAKNGIIMVQSKAGDLREPLDDPGKIVEGLSKPVIFSTPLYTTEKQNPSPEFRSTLYWSPTQRTDSSGHATVEFYTTDDIGTMTIQINGIANSGQPFSIVKSIEVVEAE